MSLSVLIRFNNAEVSYRYDRATVRLVTDAKDATSREFTVDVRNDQALEPREITRPRSGNERIEQAPLLAGFTGARRPPDTCARALVTSCRALASPTRRMAAISR